MKRSLLKREYIYKFEIMHKIMNTIPQKMNLTPLISGLVLSMLVLMGFSGMAQDPTVTVRLANPDYSCADGTYCLEVQFQSDVPDRELYGINARFFYELDVLEFLYFADFEDGYGAVTPNPPIIDTGSTAFGQAFFQLDTAAVYVNGAVGLLPGQSTDTVIPTDDWLTYFTMCFNVVNPEVLSSGNFCPTVIWDLDRDGTSYRPSGGGDGVVITLVSPLPPDTDPTTEAVQHLNWFADGQATNPPFGYPVQTDCISPECDELGDAPEKALAYPGLGIQGKFPTCINDGNNKFIRHLGNSVFFGPSWDFEIEGNHNLCTPNFTTPYDNDEGFNDGDAGLIKPKPYTISGGTVVPLAGSGGTLDTACNYAIWGQNIDITLTGEGFVNVLIDWDQNGAWGGSLDCGGGNIAYEHVLVDFPVNAAVSTPLSQLMPPNTGFQVGTKAGYVWVRFSVTAEPVIGERGGSDWDGSGTFTGGESEDYLLYVAPTEKIPLSDWAVVLAFILIGFGTLFFLKRRI